jgi:hypothetical protein
LKRATRGEHSIASKRRRGEVEACHLLKVQSATECLRADMGTDEHE